MLTLFTGISRDLSYSVETNLPWRSLSPNNRAAVKLI